MSKKKKQGTVENNFNVISDDAPFSYNEAYKSLRTNLDFVSINNRYKTVVITSSAANEGKSNVALNLVIALAQNGSKVLLLDCDLRNSRFHRFIKTDRHTNGVSDVLRGTADLNESILHIRNYNIYLLLAGTIPPNPVELLGSQRMRDLLERLSAMFDYIILDAPPVGMMTDAAVLSQLCDGVLFVVRQGTVSYDQARLAMNNLRVVNANIIGSILNDYTVQKGGSYGYYGYKYEYSYGYGYDNSAAKNAKK